MSELRTKTALEEHLKAHPRHRLELVQLIRTAKWWVVGPDLDGWINVHASAAQALHRAGKLKLAKGDWRKRTYTLKDDHE